MQTTLFHSVFKKKTAETSAADLEAARRAREAQEAAEAARAQAERAHQFASASAAAQSGQKKKKQPSQSAAACKKRAQRARKKHKQKRERAAVDAEKAGAETSRKVRAWPAPFPSPDPCFRSPTSTSHVNLSSTQVPADVENETHYTDAFTGKHYRYNYL